MPTPTTLIPADARAKAGEAATDARAKAGEAATDARAKAGEAATNSLMARYAAGDDSAFGPLYDLLAPWLLRHLRRLLRGPAHAEDILQATFLRLHRVRQRYQVGRPVAPWLLVMARRLVIDDHRRPRADAPHGDDELEQVCSHEPSAHALVEYAETARLLGEAFRSLPPSHAMAFRLTRLEGRDNAEAARLLDTTVMAVKLRTHRGKVALERALLDHLSGPRDARAHDERRGSGHAPPGAMARG